jgi:hypothetical protein
MSNALIHELTYHDYLREQIRNDFPDIDEETLADTLEGLTNLNEMLGAVVRSHLDDMEMVEPSNLKWPICKTDYRESASAQRRSANS